MFAFAESLKRQEIKLISPNANISLVFIKASALFLTCYSHVQCLLYIKQYMSLGRLLKIQILRNQLKELIILE